MNLLFSIKNNSIPLVHAFFLHWKIIFEEDEELKIYLTTGTYDFLKKLAEEKRKENIVFMANEEHALLLHETEGKSFFQFPRSYEVIDHYNHFPEKGFVVMNYIVVFEEDKPALEYELKHFLHTSSQNSGLLAARVLRPIKNEPYIFLTCWKKALYYEYWAKSMAYHLWMETIKKLEKMTNYFPNSTYGAQYYIKNIDINENE